MPNDILARHESLAFKPEGRRASIDIWLTFPAEITDTSLVSSYERLLSSEERHRESRFRLPQDRLQYRIAKAAVRTVLSRYVDLPPQAHTFINGPYGKPALSSRPHTAAGLDFNLSHTQGLIVVAVSPVGQIGVDTENVSARLAPLEIANRFFSAMENAAMASLPPPEQIRRFYELWTLKESFVKATGLGLSTPLDGLAFELEGQSLSARITSSLIKEDERWRFWQFHPTDHHVTAVCASGSAVAALNVRRCIPLAGEEPFPCDVKQSVGHRETVDLRAG